MRRAYRGLVAVAVLGLTAAASRADGPGPLRAIPAQAEWIVSIENPGRLVESVVQLEALRQLKKISFVKELFDTTNARRFYQLVGYFEKQLGHPYPELIDRLAGGGMAVGVRFVEKPVRAVLAVQAKDKELMRKFAKLALKLAEQELARQEIKGGLKKDRYREIEVVRIAGQFEAALVDGTLLLATDGQALKASIDALLDGGDKSAASKEGVVAGRKQLPAGPLAWSWLNLAAAREVPDVKAAYEMFSLEPIFIVGIGGLVDVTKRAPYATAGLYHSSRKSSSPRHANSPSPERKGEGNPAKEEGQGEEFTLAVRVPTGCEGMKPGPMIVPEKADGSLPLLEPPNALFSMSYFLDLGKLWEKRADILGARAKDLEKLDKDAGLVLGGIPLSRILKGAGPHQRVVVCQQTKSEYKVKPKQAIPAFAVVLSIRDAQFAKDLESVLRSAALLGSFGVNLKKIEEKRGDYALVGYRFPEDKKFGGDYNTIQFNYSPCFAKVGDQFIISSTMQLGRELIDLVAKEDRGKSSPATTRLRGYSSGAADLLRANKDVLLAQFVLSAALAPEAARKQLDELIALLDRLGGAEVEIHYAERESRLDVRLKLGRK